MSLLMCTSLTMQTAQLRWLVEHKMAMLQSHFTDYCRSTLSIYCDMIMEKCPHLEESGCTIAAFLLFRLKRR